VAGSLSITPAGGLTSTGTFGGPFTPAEPGVPAFQPGRYLDQLDGDECAIVGDRVAGQRHAGGGSVPNDGDGVAQYQREQPGGQHHPLHRRGDLHQRHQRDRKHDAAVSLTVTAAPVAGSLSITPAGGLTSTGTFARSVHPPSQAYQLSNPGGTSINWTATNAPSWVTVSPASGTLAAGASQRR